MTRGRRLGLLGVSAIVPILTFAAMSQLPGLGAGGLLHPGRRRVTGPAPASCDEATFAGEGVTLKGWKCHASTSRRGTVVYLHGVADNRTSAAGVIDRFGKRGFDVAAYDSRAHGESGGDACTYGFYEKQDLHRVLDTLAPGPVVLVGTSLGAAVALQEAAGDPRVTAVVAAETFSDLRTVATERAPFFFSSRTIAQAFRLAEAQGRFFVDAVSPVRAAAAITQPVLLVHGAADTETPPDHSRRVMDALAGPKRLILVPGAGHNESLRGDVWNEIERWIDAALDAERPLVTAPVSTGAMEQSREGISPPR
jgi:alpha-beta hydrolase superfamily lysophospholipase